MPNKLFQNAIQRIEQNQPPVWMMRQAGRYHKHYQNLRAKYSFMELCKIPDLASEVAFGPVDEFDFDVAILFSDILFPLEFLGMGLDYTDQGPKLGWHLTHDNLKSLKSPEEAIAGLEFQKEALKLTIEKLPKEKSVIGFIGGPWTLFTYAVMGKHQGGLVDAKKSPSLQDAFYSIILDLLERNIQLQLDGGAEVVMIFDTAAGELSPSEFQRLIINPIKRLSGKFPKKLGYYSKGTSEEQIKSVLSIKELTGVGMDHRLNIPDFIKMNKIGFTQGNFDQALLFRDGNDFINTLDEYLKPFLEMDPKERIGWVAGLGHGVLPKTPEKNVKLYVDTIRNKFK
ncbi:MAG: uroporphyrinogen decarboxylase [Leptospiraceae bacterium]|nr:uroporphyrinogen decarboxylase [Leptospiraceae bacterium]